MKEGYSQTTIANIIGVNKSTISREIRHNGAVRTCGGALPRSAVMLAQQQFAIGQFNFHFLFIPLHQHLADDVNFGVGKLR